MSHEEWSQQVKTPDARCEAKVHIRWMIQRDLAEVLAIEAEAFEFPWRETDFIHCLRQRNCIGLVDERAEQVAGFMVYELFKTRIHVLNFAVAERWRRRGVGTAMALKLIGKLSLARRSRIVLEVRESNLAALLFWRSLGFRATNILRCYYEDVPDEDAYVMEYRWAARYAGEEAANAACKGAK